MYYSYMLWFVFLIICFRLRVCPLKGYIYEFKLNSVCASVRIYYEYIWIIIIPMKKTCFDLDFWKQIMHPNKVNNYVYYSSFSQRNCFMKIYFEKPPLSKEPNIGIDICYYNGFSFVIPSTIIYRINHMLNVIDELLLRNIWITERKCFVTMRLSWYLR